MAFADAPLIGVVETDATPKTRIIKIAISREIVLTKSFSQLSTIAG